MHFTTAACVSSLIAVVSAHFQLQFPPPRGDFVAKNEPTFCDGYPNAVTNRTTFPTAGGFVSFNSEHPKWTFGGIVATVQNPDNFDNFTDGSGNFQQFLPYFQTTAEGLFCVNVSLASAGISGIKDGANVTIQLIFDGGDGKLYQCADLTLSDNATIPNSVSCTNATSNAVATPVTSGVTAPTSTSPSGTGSGAASPSATGNSALRNAAIGASGLAGVLGVVAALI
ncbi:hypothetical protein C8Q74DRAFT_567685 [Fomes fomentarius]|nr:hypothetical protein C8Q74DRAFT_567685 [Fomes fomentarius]